MAANASGVAGALYDTNATNKLGALCTGIGWGANGVYGPPLTPGMDASDTVGVPVIGSAPPYTAAEACGYAGFPAKLTVATSTVAPGGAMPDGSTNVSGRTALAGSGVFSVLQNDPDVDDWAARVTANSGSVSASTKDAVKAFVTSAKAAGYWTKLLRCNLFCGNQLAAAIVPLVMARGNTIDSGGGFVAADYTEATGIRGAAGKFMDTGVAPFFNLTANSTHLAVYNRSAVAGGAGVSIGAMNSATQAMSIYAPASDLRIYSASYENNTPLSSSVIAGPFGFLVASRVAFNDEALYARGVQVGSRTTVAGTLPISNLYVFANNNSGAANVTTHTLAGYSIGAGLTAAQVAAYSTDMQAFQTALGRAV